MPETPGTVRGIYGRQAPGWRRDDRRPGSRRILNREQRGRRGVGAPRRSKRQTISSPSGAGAGLMPSARLGPLFFSRACLTPAHSIESGRALRSVRESAKPFRSRYIAAYRCSSEAPYNQPVSENDEVEPRILPRSEHPISRRDIDKNALKVLYRLHNAGYLAYLVGGSVRDLMMGRKPKDFDVGTNAKPNEIRRLFSQLADHRPALPAGPRLLPRRQHRRGLDLPPRPRSGRAAGRAGRAADHQRQHLRHPARRTPSAATSRSTPCSTASPTTR